APADMLDDGDVVGDEEVGKPELLLQIAEQVDDLRLNRDVERRNRLVADDKPRVERQRAGNADALALSARKFVREAVERLGPEPLSPTRPKVSPSAMSNEIPSTACTCPTVCCRIPFLTGKCLTRLRTDRSGVSAVELPGTVMRVPLRQNGSRRRNARLPFARRPASRECRCRSQTDSVRRTGSPGFLPSRTARCQGSRRAAAAA